MSEKLSEVFADERLRFASKGLYAWLVLERPDLIEGSMAAICDAAQAISSHKRDAINNYVRELRRFGYLPPTYRTKPTTALAGKPGFVYLARGAANNRFKIGSSTDPTKRLKGLKDVLQCPRPVVVHVIQTADMGGLEQSLHDRYASYRERPDNEVFFLPLEAVEEIKSMTGGLEGVAS